MTIQVPADLSGTKRELGANLQRMLKAVDSAPITRKQMLKASALSTSSSMQMTHAWSAVDRARCQQLLQAVEKWLQWTGMQAKVPKCHSLGTQASSGKPFDPCLSLGGQAIPYNIGTSPIKFLGYTIQVPLATDILRNKLLKKMLQQVDEIPVTRHQKLFLYRAAICPRLNWDLAVNDLPLLWVTNKLEAEATKYLKKWSGLTKPADTSRLYLPKPYTVV